MYCVAKTCTISNKKLFQKNRQEETGGHESGSKEKTIRECKQNLWSDPRQLHQLSPCLQQWLVAQTKQPGGATQGDQPIDQECRRFVAKLVIAQNVEAIIHRVPIGIIG